MYRHVGQHSWPICMFWLQDIVSIIHKQRLIMWSDLFSHSTINRRPHLMGRTTLGQTQTYNINQLIKIRKFNRYIHQVERVNLGLVNLVQIDPVNQMIPIIEILLSSTHCVIILFYFLTPQSHQSIKWLVLRFYMKLIFLQDDFFFWGGGGTSMEIEHNLTAGTPWVKTLGETILTLSSWTFLAVFVLLF